MTRGGTFEQAKALLNDCERDELRDHAFGDAEVYWMLSGEEVASGYFGIEAQEVYVNGLVFRGDEARELRQCGTCGRVERNDAAGRTP